MGQFLGYVEAIRDNAWYRGSAVLEHERVGTYEGKMERISALIRWTIATLGSLLALAIFVPVGGSLWIVALVRAIFAFAVAMFAAAIKTSSHINPATQFTLNEAVEFFPRALSAIITNFMAMGHGKPTAAAAAEQAIDYRELTINIMLAVVFYGTIGLYFYGRHLHRFVLNVRGNDALVWIAVALGVLVVIRVFGRSKTGVVLAASIVLGTYLTQHSPQVVHVAADWIQDAFKWTTRPFGLELRLERWRIGATTTQTLALLAAAIGVIFTTGILAVGAITGLLSPSNDQANRASSRKKVSSNSQANVVVSARRENLDLVARQARG